MKKLTLLVATLLIVFGASAQFRWGSDRPDVIIIGKNSPEAEKAAADRAVKDYYKTITTGFQQSGLPRFIISGREHKFLFGMGGFVNFRTAYDFDGIVENLDFTTYDIPVPGAYDTHHKLFMDASTSRLFFKAIANTKRLGQVVSYIETDFRGANNTLRLRLAYITFKGLLFGRNVTTFCDLDASPNTIDFEGPNSYNFNYNNMIRYTRTFNNNRWKIGAALEMPSVSMSPTSNFRPIPQRLPDVPIYVQYNWGKKRSSHLRASGVFRDLNYFDAAANDDKSKFGWGAQLSGEIKLGRRITTYMQGVYGEGITPYIQDITGSGLDLVSDPTNGSKYQTLPMMGWFAALQYNFTPNLFCGAGYSQVRVYSRNDFDTSAPNDYKDAQYIFGNIFYNFNASCQIALEYLYGTRTNMNSETNHANRIQAMIQYNF